MNIFGLRKPRRFALRTFYYDERRQRLRDMEARARREMEGTDLQGYEPVQLQGAFSHRGSKRSRGLLARMPALALLLAIAVLVCLAYWLLYI